MQFTPLDIKIFFFLGSTVTLMVHPSLPNTVDMFHSCLDHWAYTANLDPKI